MAANRQRTSDNKGEQALLVMRQSGCLWTLQAVRQFAVSKSIALSPYSDTIPEEEERLSLDAATARRLVDAIRWALSDGFIGIVMEWTSTPKTAATPSNALAISVDDVAAELEIAEKAGLRTEPAALRSYPVLGEALVGACFVDDCRVEFVRFLDC